jgi:drug/metabolite transporter (DMT)-like permease
MNKPLALLLGTGAALGLNFPLGKLAVAAGVPPLLWAAYISLGAGIALFVINAWLKGLPSVTSTFARYALVSGFLSYVVPNGLTFMVIPKIGSGFAAIMFALSPVFTAALSILFKVRPPDRLGLAGIGLGFIGAIAIILAQNRALHVGHTAWLLAALLIPLFLASGNIYRTLAWPEGAAPQSLAAATNLAAVPILLAAAFATNGAFGVGSLAAVPGLAAAQLAVSTVMFLMFFRLQQEGGPTFLSQIGYVGAAVGVLIGVIWLGETYPSGVWIGAALIAVGIALSTFGQHTAART